MKKLLLVVCMILFLYSTATAGYWKRTGVLDLGTYVVCVFWQGVPTYCAVTYVADDTEHRTQGEVDAMNEEGLFDPNSDVTMQWYKYDNGYLIKYKMPWEYIEGMEM